MADLSGAEFKVVMYIVRRTYGFQKEGDTISLKQIVGGIVKRDGVRLDSGTGLNKDTVCKALATLEKKGLINRENRKDETGDLPNFYSLNLDADLGKTPGPGSNNPTGEGGEFSETPVGKSDSLGVEVFGHGTVGESDSGQSLNPTQQQTALQETELQETATTQKFVAAALSPSEEERKIETLVAEGFLRKDATAIAAKTSIETIQKQLAWLPKRKVTESRLGLLRRSIEDNWLCPNPPKQDKPDSLSPKAFISPHMESQRKLAARLRALYFRLEKDSPETFSALQGYIENAKEEQRNQPLVRNKPSRLKAVLESFSLEEKRIELMVEFLRSARFSVPEFALFVQELREPVPSWELFDSQNRTGGKDLQPSPHLV